MFVNIIGEIGINFAYGEDKSKFLDNAKKVDRHRIHIWV